MHIRSALFAVAAIALALPACKSGMGNDKSNVAEDYESTQYKENIVTGRDRRDYKDRGIGVSPGVINHIDHTIKNVYERDFERCLEDEMGRQETRFLRAVYTIEFSINTDGVVTAGKVLELSGSKQDAKGSQLGEFDPTEFGQCLETSVLSWEFDEKPEVDFKHTYRGQAGEAY